MQRSHHVRDVQIGRVGQMQTMGSISGNTAPHGVEILTHEVLELLVQCSVGKLVLLVCIKDGTVLLDESHDGDVPLRRSKHA